MEKLEKILRKATFSVYELLVILWDKVNELIDGLGGKTDVNGDHKGTWQGYTPSQTNESISSVVDNNTIEINKRALQTDLEMHSIELIDLYKKTGLLVKNLVGEDNTVNLQTALKYCFDNDITDLHLESNEVYILDNATTDCSIVISGKNLYIHGHNATIKKVNPNLGFHGDVLDIYGYVDTVRYPLTGVYTGAPIQAENITIDNLNVEASDTVLTGCNNIGIVCAKNVLLKNVRSINASSGGFVVVTLFENVHNDNIVFDNCHAVDCRELGFRMTKTFIDYGLGVNNLIMKNCSSTGVKGVYPYGDASSTGKKINLFYRQNMTIVNPKLFLTVENCYFDEEGQFISTGGCGNFTSKDTNYMGGIFIGGSSLNVIKENIIWEGGIIGTDVLKDGATTESPIHLQYVLGLTFNNVTLGKILNANLPLNTSTIKIISCLNIKFENVENISLDVGNISYLNDRIEIIGGSVKANNLQSESLGDKVLRFSGVTGLNISNVKINNALMEFLSVSKMMFNNNVCYIDKNLGTGLITMDSNTKGCIVKGNIMEIGTGSTNSLAILTQKESVIEEDNMTICNDGVYRSKITSGSAIPTGGYFFKGDRRINNNPTVGQPKSWICITNGTWVSEGNL